MALKQRLIEERSAVIVKGYRKDGTYELFPFDPFRLKFEHQVADLLSNDINPFIRVVLVSHNESEFTYEEDTNWKRGRK